MKIGIIGDGHMTNKKPGRRLDDYYATQLRKFNQALAIFKEHNCFYTIQVGDFFDAPTVANRVIADIGSILLKEKPNLLTIYGQHDISGHSETTFPNSPLNILEAHGALRMLTVNPTEINVNVADEPILNIYGASFGVEVPEVVNKDVFNVLVTHRMIGDKPLYPGQELTTPNVFLRRYPDFDLVLCGDYHYRFTSEYKGRHIINPGVMLRKSIDARDLNHEPAVIVFDTVTKEIELIKLDIESPEIVFDLKKEIKTDNAKITELIEMLKENKGKTAGWRGLLPQITKKFGCNKRVKALIDEFIEVDNGRSDTGIETE